jgi:hypothetical protein
MHTNHTRNALRHLRSLTRVTAAANGRVVTARRVMADLTTPAAHCWLACKLSDMPLTCVAPLPTPATKPQVCACRVCVRAVNHCKHHNNKVGAIAQLEERQSNYPPSRALVGCHVLQVVAAL